MAPSPPTSIIASTDDPVIPWNTIEQEVVAFFPKATLVKLSGIGHLIPLESPAYPLVSFWLGYEQQTARSKSGGLSVYLIEANNRD